jgi:drug/metabolite transporter (DMT)-like permease
MVVHRAGPANLADPMKSSRTTALVALFIGVTAIGFAPIFVKLRECGPSATAFYRILFALPFLWLWFGWEQRAAPASPRPRTWREFGKFAVAGLLFAGDMAMWHWSLRYTSVANSTLLTNFAPVLVTLGAHYFFQERMGAVFVVGLALALAGAAMVVGSSFDRSPDHLLGDAIAIVTTLFYAGYLLSVNWLRRTYSGATIMAWSGLISCPALALIALASQEQMVPVSARGWLVVLGLALVSHVGGQTLIAYAFGHLPAAFSSVSLLWQPVVAALLAWLLLGEPLGWLQSAGGVVTLAGIGLAGRTLRRTSRTDSK